MKQDVAQRIKAFNRGRAPRTLALKFAHMRADMFGFYRGTCHLFYEDWPKRSPLNAAPLAWVSGDLHPENFGTYRGRDGNVYFDVNDFDEAGRGPLAWDVVRCLTGLLIGVRAIGVLPEDGESLCRRYLYAYAAALASGQPGVVDPAEAAGMVKELIDGVEHRSANALVLQRTHGGKKKRRLVTDGIHAIAASHAEVEHVMHVFDVWKQENNRWRPFTCIDVAHRIAGTGSLGITRYVMLVRFKGSLRLLDMKDEPKSAPATFAKPAQPKWPNDADRVVTIQKRAQGSAPRPLAVIVDGASSYVVKELEPMEDKVNWQKWHGKLERLERLVGTMGEVTAWSHLRGARIGGSASTPMLRTFGTDLAWREHAMNYARSYAEHVAHDYARFCAAYDRGLFGHARRRA